MARHTGLGRGLEALLGDQILSEPDKLTEIDIKLIDPNPNQPRKTFDKERLAELSESIRSVGVISPILVAKTNDRYMIISGERRWRAARMANLTHIPAIIRDYDAMRRMEVALIENLQRDDLNPIEEAKGIKFLMDECSLTQEEAASRLGKSRPAVANTLRLLNLDAATMEFVSEGKLSEGHARALLGIDDDDSRAKAANTAISGNLSVRQTEELVRGIKNSLKNEKLTESPRAPELEIMENAFKRALGSTVTVDGTPSRGKISIRYNSFEEFERIYNIISGFTE